MEGINTFRRQVCIGIALKLTELVEGDAGNDIFDKITDALLLCSDATLIKTMESLFHD